MRRRTGRVRKREGKKRAKRILEELLRGSAVYQRDLDAARLWAIQTPPEKRLEWVVEEFIRQDLSKLTDDQRREIRERLFMILPSDGLPAPKEPGGPLPDVLLDNLQTEIREGIRALSQPGRTGWGIPCEVETVIAREGPAGPRGGDFRLRRRLGLRARVLLGVAELLAAHGRRLLACTNTNCGAPFLAFKGQKYCGEKCSQQARDRNRPKKGGSR